MSMYHYNWRIAFTALLCLMTTAAFATESIADGAESDRQDETELVNPEAQELLELQERLAATQQTAVAQNPELLAQAHSLEDLVSEKMQEAGIDTASIIDGLRAAQEKVREPGLSEAERRRLLQSTEVLEAQQRLHAAQRAIMTDPEVIAAREAFEDEMLEAMRRLDPETDDMIERVKELRPLLSNRTP